MGAEDKTTESYRAANTAWKATSKVIFGQEVGELNEFKEWLVELNDPLQTDKSVQSGREVVFWNSNYRPQAPLISMEEVDWEKKFKPLDINQIKDIDSIVQAIQDRVYYAGSIVLGNSRLVEGSTNITDSVAVYKSAKISGCKNVAYSQMLRLSENVFGVNEGGEGKWCIRSSVLYRNTRGLELWISGECRDCYYSYGLTGCEDCLFSFNLVGKRCAVGNLILPKDKYLAIKQKLVAEMWEELVSRKKLPSLMEIVRKCDNRPSETARLIEGKVRYDDEKLDFEVMEKSFSQTSEVVLGRPLAGIEMYARWLKKDTVTPQPVRSALSGRPVNISDWPGYSQLPRARAALQAEAQAVGEHVRISEEEAERISLSNAHKFISPIAYFQPEYKLNENKNVMDCQWSSFSSNCYRVVICAYTKNCAYCSWPRSSEFLFGSGIVYDSAFGLKCHESVNLKRCFEVDTARDCSDCYFCHNVENCQECMFCFNVKAKRYAIGNVEYPKEEYLKIKKLVLVEISQKLENDKKLDLSIYNIGGKK